MRFNYWIKKPRASTFKIWSLNYSTHCLKCAVCRLIGKPLGFKDIAGSFEFCTLNNKGLTPYGWSHIWNVGQTDFGFSQPLKKNMFQTYTEKKLLSYFIGLMFKYNW